MTVLVVDNLAKSFGADLVFSGVTFTVAAGERVGVVGPNGSGKTTLLEVICGRLPHDEGHVHLVGRPRLGYLEQEVGPVRDGEVSLLEHALGATAALGRMERRLRELEETMAASSGRPQVLQEVMDEYGRLREAFERAGGYAREARAREVLFGLGFSEKHLTLPVSRLSGGQRTRARLARLLLEEPDLLILDEPTNHLDLETTEWLEDHLQGFRGAMLVVSHDRYFLDRLATRILEVDRGRVTSWKGNYSTYVAQKEAWLERARETYERRQEEVERLEAFVRRYRAGSRAKAAKSREKALARMGRPEAPPGPPTAPRLRFEAPERRSGREVLRLEDVGLAFSDAPAGDGRGAGRDPGGAGSEWLFRHVDALVEQGDRIALVGRNGTGKTTLLEVIMGRLPPTSGRVLWGSGVKPAYFAQGLDDLDDDRTVLEELVSATGWDIPRSRSYLGRFLFSGDDVEKRVAVLSGGERSRLALACLIASRPNVLVMDEPTNHLDLPTREALEEALAEFTGTLIFVSHDRYFIERLADRVWELESGNLVRFEGGYAEYRVWKAGRRAREVAPPEPGPATAVRGERGPVKDGGAAAGRDAPAKLSKGRRARLERELADIEARIDRLERRRGELESLMADPDSYRGGKGAHLDADYRQVLADLEEALLRWEEVAGRLSGGGAPVPDD